jgi:hypothetical protein
MLVPVADRRSRDWSTRIESSGIDRVETGAVVRHEAYTIHRSVLQASPTSVCTIHGSGKRVGEC